MNFWWASQNRNYKRVIPLGTLWSRPTAQGGLRKDRTALKSMEVDDIVFHYGGPYLRAVSRVVGPWVPSGRPPGYPLGRGEEGKNDDGWLVRVEPFATGLELHRDRVAEILSWGSPGPLTVKGLPHEKYISAIPGDEAADLLAELDFEVPALALPGRPHENWSSWNGATDGEALTSIRREQTALRAHLLAGRAVAECGLCGETLTASLLVAGHIVPRRELAEAQRAEFRVVAMLVCLLGCDALFERGYLVVDDKGQVVAGREATSSALVSAVERRTGRGAPAWSSLTATTFAAHRGGHTGA